MNRTCLFWHCNLSSYKEDAIPNTPRQGKRLDKDAKFVNRELCSCPTDGVSQREELY